MLIANKFQRCGSWNAPYLTHILVEIPFRNDIEYKLCITKIILHYFLYIQLFVSIMNESLIKSTFINTFKP